MKVDLTSWVKKSMKIGFWDLMMKVILNFKIWIGFQWRIRHPVYQNQSNAEKL